MEKEREKEELKRRPLKRKFASLFNCSFCREQFEKRDLLQQQKKQTREAKEIQKAEERDGAKELSQKKEKDKKR